MKHYPTLSSTRSTLQFDRVRVRQLGKMSPALASFLPIKTDALVIAFGYTNGYIKNFNNYRQIVMRSLILMISQRSKQNYRDKRPNFIVKISQIDRSIWLDVA
jgi:hypothetical protein